MDALPLNMLPGEYDADVICEQIYFDFLGRRIGILKALTTEQDNFFQRCHPTAQDPFCLSGLPNDTWMVGKPLDLLPQAMTGINFVRDKMERHHWLAKVAVVSEAWLYEVAFYYAGRLGFDRSKRKELFALINTHPTLYEEMTKYYTEKPESVPWAIGRSREGYMKRTIAKAGRRKKEGDIQREGEEEGREVEQEITVVNYFAAPAQTQYRGGAKYQNAKCGGCGKKFGPDGHYLSCVACGYAFHAECTPPFTPENAEHFENNRCPDCFEKNQPARF